jgi:ABC-type sulfate transport system permease component
MDTKPAGVRPRRTRLLIQWFDTLFIMALCFLTLLSTILLRGPVLSGEGSDTAVDYSFGIGSCALVVVMFGVYVWYMLTRSERELKEMVNHVYGPKPDADPPPAVPRAPSRENGG